MHQKLADHHFEVLKHPTCEVLKHLAYSPDLAPLDCYLFSNLKMYLKGIMFSVIEEATLAEDGSFAGKPNKFFKNLE
jgi:hypothetical protein